jgi:tetratricopeptide (TPR) repeat protein
MAGKRVVRLELNPVFIAETQRRFGDVDGVVREAIPWLLTRVVAARELELLRACFNELEPQEAILRALVGCELLGQASARPDLRRWLCEYVAVLGPGDGARYQLASAWSRLGVEARRERDLPGAVACARRGLDVVADLPPRAVTANLYYNLGVALECTGDLPESVESYEHAAEIDEMIGRRVEAAQCRLRIDVVRGTGGDRGPSPSPDR